MRLLISRLALSLSIAGGVMAANAQQPTSPGPLGLPHILDSESELLASSHIFLVDVKHVDFSGWEEGDDHLLHRAVRIEIEMLEVFKGTLAEKPHDTFGLEVRQSRETEFVAYAYHGFWSHEDPEKGRRLVLSKGQAKTAAQAMKEPAIQRLLPPEFTADVRLSIKGEQSWARTRREAKSAEPEVVADLVLIDAARKSRSSLHDLFARYLWDRIQAEFATHENQILPQVWELIDAPDSATSFRAALLASLYRSTILLGADPERCMRLLPGMFGLLLRNDAAELHSELIEVQIYNLLFRPDRPPPSAALVIPDASERKRLVPVLAAFPTTRAREILHWLQG